jgi:hypothetical protein
MLIIAGVGGMMGLVRWMMVEASNPLDYAIAALAGHDTVYAPSFSERRFHRLRVGMTPAYVEEIAGPPLRVAGKDEAWGGGVREVWLYSDSPTHGHFWRRMVFFEGGRVSAIERDFWFD